MKRLMYAVACLTALVACSKEKGPVQANEQLNGSETVLATAKDFVMAGMTKTIITQNGSDAPAFAWKEGDVIGIIPMNNETVQSNYKIAKIGADPKTAMFDGGVWALKEGKEYAAYYPYQYEAIPSSGSLTFSFLGQTQTANNSLAHLGAYDYMYASSVISTSGVATFQFNHLVSLVRLQLTVPATDTYKAVRLESDNAWFASGASLKLSDGTMSATETVKSATINLDDIAITANGVLTVWFATLPTSALNGQTLSVKIFGAENTCTGEVTGITTLAAGSAYSYASILSSEGKKVEYVDLGLSVKWATCNLGATKPEDYGGYYQWAGTEDVTSTSIYLDWSNCPYHNTGSSPSTGWTKYVPSDKSSYWSGAGSPDNKTVLDPDDDVAYSTLGGNWRMPTYAEWCELIDNCQCDWVTYEGVKGRKFTSKKSGYTDKWIFLPAADRRNGDYLICDGLYGNYWSSSLGTDTPNYAIVLYFGSNNVYTYDDYRYFGLSVRPVLVDMSTHTHALSKINGQAPTTTSSGWKDYYQCTESLCGLYFEDAEGVTSIGDEAALAAWKAKGGRGYLAPITEVVDLGLSVKWRGWNLGATKPEEYYGYYQWAGTEDVKSPSIYLDWSNCPYHTGSSSDTGWTKYVPSDKSSYWSGSGSPDNKTVLDPEDDVARVTLGGSWRMPTRAEWTELIDNCIWTWTSDYNGTGIAGSIVTSKISGYTDKSIFLPAAGYRINNLFYVGSFGCYWSSSLYTDYPDAAYCLNFGSDGVYTDGGGRCGGLSVRPVSD